MIITFFDTETDSLIENSARRLDKQPRIIELFALQMKQDGDGGAASFSEIGTYNQLFAYPRKLSEEVMKITGLTDDDLAGKPAFAAKASEVAAFLTSGDRVVAHNLSYDKAVVEAELARLEKTISWPELLCTVEATEHLKGYRLSLTALHEYLFGEAFASAHRAENDVRAMADCYMELVRREEI